MNKIRSESTTSSINGDPLIYLKTILLGDPGVGKTNIINRFISQQFDSSSNPTLGSTFVEKKIRKGRKVYCLKIWDTTGQEKYRSITKLFIKGAQIVILVYAIDKLETFKNLNIWHEYINEQLSDSNYILAVVGNKKDLILSEEVPEEEGKKYADEKGAFFKEVSAKCDEQGIVKLFENLLDQLVSRDDSFISNDSSLVKIHKNNEKKKCC